MQKLSRTAWIAIAAVTAVPATIAVAKAVDHRGGFHRMSPDARARFDEGKLAFAKAALKLSADQEKLWAPVEAQVRTFFKDREAKMAERQKMWEQRKADRDAAKSDGKTDGKAGGTAAKRPDMAERLEKMSQNMTERAERMKSFAGAFKPFYASLSDEQKDVLRPLARDLMPGMGGRGHKGGRFARGGEDGGWGGRGGHHGKGHHGGWGGRHHDRGGDRGGPMMDDGGPDDDAAGNAPTPPAGDAPKQ